MNDPRLQSDDPELDRLLNRVPMPGDLLARLKAIPVEEVLLDEASLDDAASDAELDRRLLAVDIPPGLHVRLKETRLKETPLTDRYSVEVPTWRRRSTQLALLFTAASLLIAVGVWSYLLPGPAGDGPAGWIADDQFSPSGVADPNPEMLVHGLAPFSDAHRGSVAPRFVSWPQSGADSPAPIANNSHHLVANSLELLDQLAQEQRDAATWNRQNFSFQLPENLAADTFLMRWQPLGARPEPASTRPKPQVAHDHSQVATLLPAAKGYDRDFALRERTHPQVSPQTHPELVSLSVDLSPDESSFERMVIGADALQSGSGLTSTTGLATNWDHLRLEECLAATSRFFVPAEAAQLELRTAAGPAVFAPAGTSMLQVGVLAGTFPPEQRPPTHLTVAVERPGNSNAERQTWWRVKSALRRVIHSLGPHDTISLVVMDEFSYTLVDDAGPQSAKNWLAALDQIQPTAARHLAEGIRYAASVAVSKPAFGDIRRPLVVLSEGFTEVDADLADRLRPIAEHAAEQDVELHWVQLEDSLWIEPASIHPLWSEVGTWHATAPSRHISATLNDLVQGQSSVIGRNARVTVRWNPEAVRQYRLLGHEPIGAGLVSDPHSVEFHPEDAASLLFEVTLVDDPPNEIAQIELHWTDAAGQSQVTTQAVSHIQFAQSWQASPLSLQAAQLTAQAVGLLKNSYYTRRRGNSSDELERYAKRMAPVLQAHPQLDRLERLLDFVRITGQNR
ncbi:MAG: hypothetical protein WD045_16310 [Pirellulaceae bacterium]